MYAIYCIYICIFIFVIIITRIYFMIFSIHNINKKKVIHHGPVRTMIILGSGGHTAEMIRILRYLNFNNYSPRIYICADTDEISIEKVKKLEKCNTDYKIIKIRRCREIYQSYYTSVYTTLCATIEAIPLLWSEYPDLLLCNGPGTCVPLCIKMDRWTSITRSISWNLLMDVLQKYLPIEMKIHLTATATDMRIFTDNKTSPPTYWITDSLILVDACLDKTWEILNSGHWQYVAIEYRHCYSFCCILKAILLEFQYNNDNNVSITDDVLLKGIIQQVDKGILLGAPLPNAPYLLPKVASLLHKYSTKSLACPGVEELMIDSQNLPNSILPGFSEIIHYTEPSMELFYKEIFMPKVPAVLEGCTKHWKALHQWKDINYLKKVVGNRMVPVEIGSRYTDENWTQQILSFSEFLQKYVLTKGDQIGYLAQHDLFDQVPELKCDFAVPEYCNFTDSDNDVEEPDINAWFGPSGTISPLHFDPKNNLLCQVVGYKRVILYHPNDSSNLYSYDTRLLNNTAQVDPLNPDYEKWPKFRNSRGLMCYLKPGDMLYIPSKWWHHVTSLSPSFSISFWWN